MTDQTVLRIKSPCFVSLVFLSLACLLTSCSPEQNTFTADIYHNLTAHFNGYYYALEKAQEVESLILQNAEDDPRQILRLFPKLDTSFAQTYTADTEEIIKMASISIQRHPNSKWADDNYILAGRARFYDGDFQNAIITFKYVNTNSHDTNTRHEALIHLLRTFTEQGDYIQAEEVILFLEKESLNKENTKNFYMSKAYYHQVRGDFDNMVRSLTTADPLLARKDRKGRIYFIIGQVYQTLGFESGAYDYYQKCLSTNPEYEIDFYARLNMAQVAQLTNTRDVRTVRKQFDDLLADGKNAEYVDLIYYEFGEFERKNGNLPQALNNYERSAHAGLSQSIQGNAYLRMGQVYFDSLRQYRPAKSYYDSAIVILPADAENYDAIKRRQEVLGEFVTHTETIAWQDSLLHLATLDSLTVRMVLDSAIALRNQPEENERRNRRRRSGNVTSSPARTLSNSTNATSDWYFGNASAVALGELEFQRIWGNVSLEDNWRRSSRIVTQGVVNTPNTIDQTTEATPAIETETIDEAGQVISQLPLTADQKSEALAQIEEAYFQLGDLYYFELEEEENAIITFEILLSRFPGTGHSADVLYKLYLLYQDRDAAASDRYARQLLSEYPGSSFARIIENPDYLKEASVTTEKQKTIYREAYADYQSGNLRSAQERIVEALALGDTDFNSQLQLLMILITGKTESIVEYQSLLRSFIETESNESLKLYAGNLLTASENLQQRIERGNEIRFVFHSELPHRFVIVYPINVERSVMEFLRNVNRKFNAEQPLIISSLDFDDTRSLLFVTDFSDQTAAERYLAEFTRQSALDPTMGNVKFDKFVITGDNFNLLYRTKALNEYLTFFDRNYKTKNQ